MDRDDVSVRSIRGSAGRWYPNLRANPDGTVRLARRTLRVRAVAVRGPALLRRVSDAYRRKYGRSPYLRSVLEPHTLAGTLRLEPA